MCAGSAVLHKPLWVPLIAVANDSTAVAVTVALIAAVVVVVAAATKLTGSSRPVLSSSSSCTPHQSQYKEQTHAVSNAVIIQSARDTAHLTARCIMACWFSS
jgi:hypothetical protein